MTNDDHKELARALNAAKGKVAMSNYPCEFMNKLYPAPRWRRILGNSKTIHSTKGTRVEALWVNYEIPNNDPQPRLEFE